MSNSRRFRRSLAASKQARAETRPRYPYAAPSLSTVRRQVRQAVADGDIEAKGVQRTGKPGRPPVQYGLTKQGREKKWTAPQITDMITRAVHDRKYKQVPRLLWLLSAKDPGMAKRAAESIARLVPEDVRQGWDLTSQLQTEEITT